jgi:hypothetical protein
MTPQERKLLDELFDRLATLENNPRDPEAVKAINDGLMRAPNALYPLVQSVLVQDEALKRANARIQELESELGVQPGQPAQQPSFLDQMRDTLFGKPGPTQGSVPSVRPGAQTERSPWSNAGQQGGPSYQPPQSGAPWNNPQAQSPGFGGGSFLGTAAATAAGVVGGALLMNSIRGMFGSGGGHQSFGDYSAGDRGTPWGGNDSGSDLARQAGIDDMGAGGRSGFLDSGDTSQRAGLFDASSEVDVDDNDYDVGGDFGGGDSDNA